MSKRQQRIQKYKEKLKEDQILNLSVLRCKNHTILLCFPLEARYNNRNSYTCGTITSYNSDGWTLEEVVAKIGNDFCKTFGPCKSASWRTLGKEQFPEFTDKDFTIYED